MIINIPLRAIRISIILLLFGSLIHSSFAQQVPFAEVVPFVTTPMEVVEAMLDMAEVRSDDVLYDLGSGDGRIPIAAAQKFGIRAVGIEIDPDLVELALRQAQEGRVADKVYFLQGDIFEMDFSEASVLTLYLFPDINLQLYPKLMDLAPGTRIVSHKYPIEGWEPEKTRTIEDSEGNEHKVYKWTVPKRQ